MFESIPRWFKRLALDWDKYGFTSYAKALRQAEREIEQDRLEDEKARKEKDGSL